MVTFCRDFARRALECGGLTPLLPLGQPFAQVAVRRAARGITFSVVQMPEGRSGNRCQTNAGKESNFPPNCSLTKRRQKRIEVLGAVAGPLAG